jgi:hypothetical protein
LGGNLGWFAKLQIWHGKTCDSSGAVQPPLAECMTGGFGNSLPGGSNSTWVAQIRPSQILDLAHCHIRPGVVPGHLQTRVCIMATQPKPEPKKAGSKPGGKPKQK